MIITSIDPGMSTGVVICKAENFGVQIIDHLTCNSIDIPFLKTLNSGRFDADLFLVEKPPTSAPHFMWEIIYLIIDYASSLSVRREKQIKVVEIYPGLWKPFAKGRGWMNKITDYPNLNTRHEIDAFNMLKYYWMVGK